MYKLNDAPQYMVHTQLHLISSALRDCAKVSLAWTDKLVYIQVEPLSLTYPSGPVYGTSLTLHARMGPCDLPTCLSLRSARENISESQELSEGPTPEHTLIFVSPCEHREAFNIESAFFVGELLCQGHCG